jgi:hypothetical protein
MKTILNILAFITLLTSIVHANQRIITDNADGYIAKPQVVKNQPSDKKHLISKELAKSLKKKADSFFDNMPGRVVTLEYKDKNISAAIYMKAYFTVLNDKKEKL